VVEPTSSIEQGSE